MVRKADSVPPSRSRDMSLQRSAVCNEGLINGGTSLSSDEGSLPRKCIEAEICGMMSKYWPLVVGGGASRERMIVLDRGSNTPGRK